MRIVVPTVAAALVLLAAAAAPAPVTASERQVPAGWLGVTADGPLGAAAGGEWDLMATSGVESVRTAVRWNELQPYASAAAVPPQDAARFRDVGGVPTDFTGLDALVAVAAQRGLAVLPVLQSTAGWAARRTGDTTSPPRDPAAFARFLGALVDRYGPRGSLWDERGDRRRRARARGVSPLGAQARGLHEISRRPPLQLKGCDAAPAPP